MRIGLRFVLVGLFVVVIAQSVALLAAATIERNTERRLQTGGGFAGVQGQLAFARRLDPTNLRLVALTLRQERDPDRRSELVRQMVELEPRRPDGWLRLLQHKLGMSEYDEELYTILKELERLAPYEPEVQEITLREGLRHWLELSPPMRRSVVDTGVRAMKSRAPFRLKERHALVAEGGLLPLVCRLSPDIDACAGPAT